MKNNREWGQSECLDLCKNYDWFACEYHQKSHNCIAVFGTVDPDHTIMPEMDQELGFCYINPLKI